MEQHTEGSRFPQQDGPEKLHGEHDEHAKKEKYIRDAGNIEDLPGSENVKNRTNTGDGLTDMSGEEKKEDYINTDERKRDLERK